MGWQSPQPGHQSAGSLRKHLRELGRQLKGADWHYRKVTQSMVCLAQQFYVPADSLGRLVISTGRRSLWRHPLRTQPGQAGTDYRTRAWAALGIAAAVLPSLLPNLQAQEDPPLQSHSYLNHLAESPHFHTLSHSEGAKRGSPAYKNHTTSQQLRSTCSSQTFERATKESKHHYTPHTWQSLPLPKAIRKAASPL